jgi:hypothetical protein
MTIAGPVIELVDVGQVFVSSDGTPVRRWRA